MSDAQFVLSPSAAPPPTEADYEAIFAAVMETARGRWFLAEFAKRNRNADSELVLAALDRVESVWRQRRETSPAERVRFDLLEMAKAIAQTKSEIAAITPEGEAKGTLVEATEELGSIVQTTEQATSAILAAAEQVQEIAWTLREHGTEGEVCDSLDQRATDIYSACSFQDLTGQRTRKVVDVMRFLEERIKAMIDIWGDTAPASPAAANAGHPPRISDAAEGHLDQPHIDEMMPAVRAAPAHQDPKMSGNGHDVAGHEMAVPAAEAPDPHGRHSGADEAPGPIADTQDAGTHEAGTDDGVHTASTHEAPAQDAAALDGAARDPAAQDAAVRDPAADDVAAQDLATHGIAGQDTSAQDVAAQDAAAQDAAAQDAAPQDLAVQVAAANDAAAQDVAGQDVAAKDAAAQDAGRNDAIADEVGVRDTGVGAGPGPDSVTAPGEIAAAMRAGSPAVTMAGATAMAAQLAPLDSMHEAESEPVSVPELEELRTDPAALLSRILAIIHVPTEQPSSDGPGAPDELLPESAAVPASPPVDVAASLYPAPEFETDVEIVVTSFTESVVTVAPAEDETQPAPADGGDHSEADILPLPGPISVTEAVEEMLLKVPGRTEVASPTQPADAAPFMTAEPEPAPETGGAEKPAQELPRAVVIDAPGLTLAPSLVRTPLSEEVRSALSEHQPALPEVALPLREVIRPESATAGAEVAPPEPEAIRPQPKAALPEVALREPEAIGSEPQATPSEPQATLPEVALREPEAIRPERKAAPPEELPTVPAMPAEPRFVAFSQTSPASAEPPSRKAAPVAAPRGDLLATIAALSDEEKIALFS